LSGAFQGRTYLSTNPDGTAVDLWRGDDASGRQRWRIARADGDWYTVEVLGGVFGDKRYLGISSDGKGICMHRTDDGTGRQRWLIPGFEELATLEHFDGRGGKAAQGKKVPRPIASAGEVVLKSTQRIGGTINSGTQRLSSSINASVTSASSLASGIAGRAFGSFLG